MHLEKYFLRFFVVTKFPLFDETFSISWRQEWRRKNRQWTGKKVRHDKWLRACPIIILVERHFRDANRFQRYRYIDNRRKESIRAKHIIRLAESRLIDMDRTRNGPSSLSTFTKVNLNRIKFNETPNCCLQSRFAIQQACCSWM